MGNANLNRRNFSQIFIEFFLSLFVFFSREGGKGGGGGGGQRQGIVCEVSGMERSSESSL